MDIPGWKDKDCEREEDHLWEKLSDGTYFCVWCDARVKRIGK